MPDHVKFILRHAALGALAAVVFVGLLMWFNVANIWHLVTHTSEGPIALAVMTAFFAITFGSVQVGFKIMSMGNDDDDRSGGKREAVAPRAALRAIPIRADDRR